MSNFIGILLEICVIGFLFEMNVLDVDKIRSDWCFDSFFEITMYWISIAYKLYTMAN